MAGKCKFSDKWLDKETYKSWLQRSSSADKAFCSVCSKDFSISAMGESGVVSHSKGKKHTERFNMANMNNIANYTQGKENK